jgi:hypothetical protein
LTPEFRQERIAQLRTAGAKLAQANLANHVALTILHGPDKFEATGFCGPDHQDHGAGMKGREWLWDGA